MTPSHEGARARADAYLPAVTGLRGVAALWVLLFHLYDLSHRADIGWGSFVFAPLLTSGYLGVDLFFVLSGFLLAPAFIDGARRAQGLWPFWRNRLRRVLPALWAQLVILLAIAAVWGAGLPPLGEIAAHFSLSFNLWGNESAINGVYWSLPVEWNFYMVLPLMALVFRGSARRALAGVLVFLLLAIGFRLLCVWSVHRYGADGLVLARWIIQLPGRLDQFGFGMAAAWLLLRHPPSPALARTLAWSGLIAALALAALASELGNFVVELGLPWVWLFSALIALAFAALMLGASADPRGAVARGLQWWPLAWLGMVSYSLYLWHAPLLYLFNHWFARPAGLLDCVLLAALSMAVAGVSYRFIERPFLGARARRSEQLERPA
ncbi:acyltransferase family protein [Aquimonas sp.]|jgi:peptidoglycan/LPS O-acetylase OafA/YrhL|uniref:acyltransferase family protein n=1 Tax=Aquimonas sp. TaxID=1872588 RepID=UPI0037BE7EF8